MRYLGVLLAVVWMMIGAVLPLQDVHAQGLLPTTEIAHPQGSVTSCDDLRGLRTTLGPSLHGYYLVTKIRCGLMQVGDIPFYVKGILEFLLRLAATISVIMIMVGGYQYAIGAITDNKEQGKKTITSAIIGLIVALVAWIVINAIQVLVTFTIDTPPMPPPPPPSSVSPSSVSPSSVSPDDPTKSVPASEEQTGRSKWFIQNEEKHLKLLEQRGIPCPEGTVCTDEYGDMTPEYMDKYMENLKENEAAYVEKSNKKYETLSSTEQEEIARAMQPAACGNGQQDAYCKGITQEEFLEFNDPNVYELREKRACEEWNASNERQRTCRDDMW